MRCVEERGYRCFKNLQREREIKNLIYRSSSVCRVDETVKGKNSPMQIL